VAISQAIANIIKNKQHQESQGYWRAISLPFIGFCAGMLMIGLAAGLVSGLAIQISVKGKGFIAPLRPRQGLKLSILMLIEMAS
jgi:hypothetical protein